MALIIKSLKRLISNKKKFRRGVTPYSNAATLISFKGKGKQEHIRKQNDKCFECGQVGHYDNEYPTKRKKEYKGEMKQHFTNYQLTWNECSSDGEIDEEFETTQMAFIALGDEQVTSNYNSCDDNDTDNVESIMLRMHESLKGSFFHQK